MTACGPRGSDSNEAPAGKPHPAAKLPSGDAHAALDAAVAAAYGWPADISEDEALSKLLALNSTDRIE